MATTEPNYEFPLPKDGYAAFDAISMRNLILQRLDNQGIYTDQNYVGSNLAAIIDVVSYSFNTLIYYLNKTSSEATFSEAQIFENITKLVKILDYKPVGFQTSTLAFSCSASNMMTGSYTIPRYTYVNVNNIPFSFNEDISFTIANDSVTVDLTEISNRKLLYQGVYRETPIYTANGDPNEVFIIETNTGYIDHFNMDVYVLEKRTNKWHQYDNVSHLYTQDAGSKSFEKTLTSNSKYEIKFGDGVNGRKLEEGDSVIVFYLQSSGNNGVIGPNSLQNSPTAITFYSKNLEKIKSDLNLYGITYLTPANLAKLSFSNNVGSTYPRKEENADSIRSNAPAAFKSQYRLITQKDFVSYIKTAFSQFISDVKVFSNWDYTGQYLKYFKDLNVSPMGFRQIPLNQISYADACNFNNIYVCCVPRISLGATLKYLLPSQKELIKSSLEDLKCLTAEVTFVDPIYKALVFGVKDADGTVTSQNLERTILSIKKLPASSRTPNSIRNEVISKIREFFEPLNSILGGTFRYTDLLNSLLSISGVSDIKTTNTLTGVTVPGVSFFMWNPNYPDLDMSVIASNIVLKDFEYLYFEDLNSIGSKIVVE